MRADAITLRDTQIDELARISEMEQGDARDFIAPYSLERHRDELLKPDVVYKSIYRNDDLVGFVILVLDPDGHSVEFRRIVVSNPGLGYGKRAVAMVGELCHDELGRERVWLDVLETNARARHVYEECGYEPFGVSEYLGRALVLYQRTAEHPRHRES
jgi:RimJ/RimL family protein N-acetyltransferase